MYKTLFNAITDTIDILQIAQRETEEMYMSAKEPQLILLESATINGGAEENKQHDEAGIDS